MRKINLNIYRDSKQLNLNGEIPERLTKDYFVKYILNQLNNSSSYDKENIHNCIDLLFQFDSRELVFEVFWDNQSNAQDFYYHFLKSNCILTNPIVEFTVKRKFHSLPRITNTQWRDSFIQWNKIIKDNFGFQIIKLIKAPLLQVCDLKTTLKWNSLCTIFKGQVIEGNEFYFSNLIHTYCLPLKQIIGIQHKSIITYNKDNLCFNYNYTIERKTAGSGWYETNFFKGIIHIITWEKQEELFDTIKEKWD